MSESFMPKPGTDVVFRTTYSFETGLVTSSTSKICMVKQVGRGCQRRLRELEIVFVGTAEQCAALINRLRSEHSRHQQAASQLRTQHAERVAKIIEQAKKDAA